MSRRVVVTGVGIVAPNGIGNEECFNAMVNGVSGIERVTEFDVSQFNTKIAAQVRRFDPIALGLTRQEAIRMDRYVQFAVVAARMAWEDSGLGAARIDKERMGVSLANAICGTKYMEEEFALVTDSGKNPIDPSLVRQDLYDAAMFNTPSSEIAARYGLQGICNTISTGCTAGTDSVGFSYEAIQSGEADIMFTGASEAPITPITFGAFDCVNVLSASNDEPHKASRPFDLKRNGFVISEGAGLLVVEELEHALRRGARIYCEITGYGTTNNAFHMTDLPPEGDAMADSIVLAMQSAGIKPDDIDYINAHGSSTRQNDVFETNAYKMALGDAAYRIPISSVKSMIGHPLAGANGVELALGAIIFKRNILPPTINQEFPDPECDLDYIPNKAREKKVNIMLKTSSGFSGIHSAMVLKRFR
ncbi:MAG TPA: beta-ketoacyl-[acyl-carrier-protein] synthase family protein [Candidatus Omnitrophota bacterium]|nr:beta-ketoacyl-[acyl-carrier-protein] synthase family protein [Candidatus Omnitrophota bacterium]HQO58336.1 beta-ketoacyl-[acyl-carrier-protein] synthase family protein [Candidatus Omnitrophota bacterium]